MRCMRSLPMCTAVSRSASPVYLSVTHSTLDHFGVYTCVERHEAQNKIMHVLMIADPIGALNLRIVRPSVGNNSM